MSDSAGLHRNTNIAFGVSFLSFILVLLFGFSGAFCEYPR